MRRTTAGIVTETRMRAVQTLRVRHGTTTIPHTAVASIAGSPRLIAMAETIASETGDTVPLPLRADGPRGHPPPHDPVRR